MSKSKFIVKHIVQSKILLTIFTMIVLLVLYHAATLYVKRVKVWRKVETLQNEKHELEIKYSKINQKQKDLETPFGKEAVLREQFNIVSEGESVVILTEPLTEDQSNSNQKKSIWQVIVSFFKK